jgi:tetratricopeptide (TPR) repeat protein
MSAAGSGAQNPSHVLANAARTAASGILTATRGKHRRLVCIQKGRVVFVASNVLEEQLNAMLVTKKLLTKDERDLFQREAEATGTQFAMLLIQKKRLSPDELYEFARERTRELLFSTLEWTDGEFSFSQGQPKLEGELTVELPCISLLFEHAQRYPSSITVVRKRIGSNKMRPIPTDQAEQVRKLLKLDERALQVLQHSRGSLTVRELVARVEGSTEEVLRTLYALMQVGVLRPAKDSEMPRMEAAESISRQEVLGRLERIDEADHYAVLGLPHKSSTEEIREAYYYLARRYHPDRFRTGHLQDLLDRMESYFTKVTEAYNTLFDPDRRTHYDEEQLSSTSSKSSEPQQDTAYLARQNYARGKLLVDKKQLSDAVRFFENAVELDPSKALYHLDLGRILILNPRRRPEAEEFLNKSVAMNPALVEAYLALGELYEKTDRVERAVSSYEEALRWEPTHETAQERLAALQSTGRRKGLFKG